MEEPPSKSRKGIRLTNLIVIACLLAVSLAPSQSALGLAEPPPITKTYLTSIYNYFTPGMFIINRNQPAFDTCRLPDLNAMKVWWDNSPYRTIGLYLGGPNSPTDPKSYCSFAVKINPDWVQQVNLMGWTFIPVWVGPQPFSWFDTIPDPSRIIADNPESAYLQGIGQANAAVDKAHTLGFNGDLVIYLDVEGYREAKPSETERQSVASYVSGWVNRLHELGQKAGVYGSWRNSFMDEWLTSSNIPDDIWNALWLEDGYRPDASVLDCHTVILVSYCIPATVYPVHQRIVQYAGEINESWGGISITPQDVNIVDGDIQAYGQQGISATPKPGTGIASATIAYSPQIQANQLIGDSSGWVIVEGRLFWLGGGEQKDISPGDISGLKIKDAFFLDELRGWVIASTAVEGQYKLLATNDAGQTWNDLGFPVNEELQPGIPREIQFTNSQVGWITAQFGSNAIFRRMIVYRTTDGGASWDAYTTPIPGQITFVDDYHGWLAGEDGSGLYVTVDGGKSWSIENLPGLQANDSDELYEGLPVFDTGGSTILTVVSGQPGGYLLHVFSLDDTSNTWTLATVMPLELPSFSGSLPASAAGDGKWMIALPNGKLLKVSRSPMGGFVAQFQASDLPEGVTNVQFTDSNSGWATVQQGSCSGDKINGPFYCQQSSELYQTQDGGVSWVRILN